MKVWDDVVAAALLGTERKPPPAVPADGALGKVLSSLDGQTLERSLLSSAAALTVYRRAGYRPALTDEALPEAAGPDHLPICSPAAAERLMAILEGPFRFLLGEWLELLQKSARRVPEEHLPALFDLGAGHPAEVASAAGERGRWLAKLNPRWGYLVQGDRLPEDLWATGTRYERQQLLKGVRLRDPALGLRLLSSTWREETGEDRAAFLKILRQGLGPDDEEFLVAALGDRRKEIRMAAADLLARLPNSRLAGRMAERTRSLLQLKGRFSKKISISLPGEYTDEMALDGIELKGPRGVGQRGWWLSQLIAATPLDIWTSSFGLSAEEVLKVPVEEEWATLVRQAWAAAAVRQTKPDWALGLLDYIDDPALLEPLPPPLRQTVLIGKVKDLGIRQVTLAMLRSQPDRWGPELSRAVLGALTRLVDVSDGPQGPLGWGHVESLATFCDPGLLTEASAVLGRLLDQGGPARKAAEDFLDILQFRADMRKELE